MNTLIPANIRQPAAILGIFAIVCLLSVSAVYWLVRPHILAQEYASLLANFRAINGGDVPVTLLDSAHTMQLDGRKVTVYNGSSGSHFIEATTGKGYSGNITVLIGIQADNRTLLGVRVLKHHETPGLGDKIEVRISPWILAFSGKSLDNTAFAVKKDGGDFDAFTGATITPRAVTNLVGGVLHAWAQDHAGKEERNAAE